MSVWTATAIATPPEPATRTRFLPEKGAADDHLLDLGGAPADRDELRVTHSALDRELLDVAVAPEHLSGLDRVLHRGLGDEVLRDARLHLVGEALLLHPRGPVEDETGGVEIRLHLRDL